MTVVPQILKVKKIPEAPGLIKKPAAPLGAAGNKVHVLMAENHRGGDGKNFLPVVKTFPVEGDDFFIVPIGHVHGGIKRPFKDHRGGTVLFTVPDQILIPDAPEGRSIGTVIKGFKKVGFALAVFAYKEYVFSPNFKFGVVKVTKGNGF